MLFIERGLWSIRLLSHFTHAGKLTSVGNVKNRCFFEVGARNLKPAIGHIGLDGITLNFIDSVSPETVFLPDIYIMLKILS